MVEHQLPKLAFAGSIPVSRSMKKSSFVRKRTSSMISVPVGTGDICFAYDIRFAGDIRLRRMEERILYHACYASISYGGAVYHIA